MNSKKEQSSKKQVLVIGVNYHSDKETRVFINEILEQQCSCNIDVLIVDNSRLLPESLSRTESSGRRVLIYKPDRNLGYLGGADWALNQYLQTSEIPEWVVISNTDIYVPDRRFFHNMVLDYEADEVGVIAPDVFSPKLGHQNPFMEYRPSRFRMHFYKWVFKSYISTLTYEFLATIKSLILSMFRRLKQKNAISQPRNIYAPHGSFIVLNKAYFQRGGLLKYGAFLFADEIFVAETAMRLNLKAVYDPHLKVIHYGHGTVGLSNVRKIWKYMAEASAYCADTLFTKGVAK